MKGISFLTDENGHKTAVVIDIQTYGEELQNFLDGLAVELRQSDSKEDFAELVKHIQTEKENIDVHTNLTETQDTSTKMMNEQLVDLYEEYLPKINKEIENCIAMCNWNKNDISKLFFMHVSDEYVKAKTKIMFVGSETHGWDVRREDDSVSALTDFYRVVSENGTHFNSLFWWFRRDFSRSMDVEDSFMKSTLWTNLSKIDVAKKKPEGHEFGQLAQLFIKLLVAEISIVKPDIVLIMTANGFYEWHINNYNWKLNEPFSSLTDLNGMERKTLLKHKVDRLIVNELLPQNTFQLPHPNSFRYIKGGYKITASDIIDTIEKNLL